MYNKLKGYKNINLDNSLDTSTYFDSNILSKFSKKNFEEKDEYESWNDDITKLDDKWIIDFNNKDNLYYYYYREDNYSINLRLIYINNNNEIEKISVEPYFLSKPNIITRDELINIISKKNVIYISPKKFNKYSLLSLLKYNFDIENIHINSFLNEENDNFMIYNPYFHIIKNIDDIKFNKTINFFTDLNELIIIFYNKKGNLVTSNNTTINNTILNNNNSNTSTKKIFLHKKIKTRKNK
jgi:hypothetical protein